jgi:hypothetical protein
MRILKRLSVKDRAELNQILAELECKEFELAYYKAIVDGTWPGADDLIKLERERLRK